VKELWAGHYEKFSAGLRFAKAARTTTPFHQTNHIFASTPILGCQAKKPVSAN
jgi:hypothetical protein